MFKYFFGCPKDRIVANGKLVLDALGEASVALRDCRIDQSQCNVSDQQSSGPLGAGTVIDPFPGDRSVSQAVFGVTKENHPHWKWIAFESGLFKPDGERVQALIGYDTANATATAFDPAVLRRRRIIGGGDIKDSMDLERKWHIPTARSPAMAYGMLSTRWEPNPGGGMKRVLDKHDQWLWDLSGEVQDYLIWARNPQEERPQWRDPWAIETAIAILGVNYRIGRPELAALADMDANPLTDNFVMLCLHGVTGFGEYQAWMEELQKKTSQDTNRAPEPSNSGSGAPADANEDSAGVN